MCVCVCVFFNVHDFVSLSIVLSTNLVVHYTPPKNKPFLSWLVYFHLVGQSIRITKLVSLAHRCVRLAFSCLSLNAKDERTSLPSEKT